MKTFALLPLLLCGCDFLGGWTLTGSGSGATGTATITWDGGAVTVHCEPIVDAGAEVSPDATADASPEAPVYPPDPGPAILEGGRRVLFLGDSITGVSVWQQVFTRGADAEFGATTHPLWSNAGFNGATVSPRSWAPSGYVGTGTYLDPAHQAALESPYAVHPIAIIVLFIGVNDVIVSPPTPDAEFEFHYNQLVDHLTTLFPEAKLVVMGPWLAGELKPDGRTYSTRPNGSSPLDAEMNAKNGIVKRICLERGIRFVNVRDAFFTDGVVDWTVVAQDGLGVHPTGSGDQFLANVLREQGIRLRD